MDSNKWWGILEAGGKDCRRCRLTAAQTRLAKADPLLLRRPDQTRPDPARQVCSNPSFAAFTRADVKRSQLFFEMNHVNVYVNVGSTNLLRWPLALAWYTGNISVAILDNNHAIAHIWVLKISIKDSVYKLFTFTIYAIGQIDCYML